MVVQNQVFYRPGKWLGKRVGRYLWAGGLLLSLLAGSASAHNKVVVIPMAGDDKPTLPAGRVAADSPDEGDYYVTANTAIDHATGLEWMREDDNTQMQWAVAVGYCGTLTHGGHSDWRLPTVNELMSIVDYAAFNLLIDASVFPNTNPEYWSASSTAENSSLAWRVLFNNGDVDAVPKTYGYYVRCVRGAVNTADFKHNGDDTVTDWDTGLTWQRQGDNTYRNWQAALDYCAGLTLAGGGWRLPASKELASIVDYTQFDRAINTAMFPNIISPDYWSASSNASSSSNAWGVSFRIGSVYDSDKANRYAVRCVR